MPSEVLEFFRQEQPKFREVPDDELTTFIGQEFPEFLQGVPEFKKRFDLVNQKQTVERNQSRRVGPEWEQAAREPGIFNPAAVASLPDIPERIANAAEAPVLAVGSALSGAGRMLGEDARKGLELAGISPARMPGQIIQEGARMLPVVGATMLGGAAGVPIAVAGGAPMAAQAYAETKDPEAAVRSGMIGALIPGASKLGGQAGARLAGRAVAALPAIAPAIEDAAVAAGRFLGSQSMVDALMVANDAPDLLRLAKEDPDKARDELTKLVASNLVWEVPHLASGAREALARSHVDQYLNSPDYHSAVNAAAAQGAEPILHKANIEQPPDRAIRPPDDQPAPAYQLSREVPANEELPPEAPAAPPPPPITKEDRLASREFDQLLLEHGPQEGWFDNPQALDTGLVGGLNDKGSIQAKLIRHAEITKARRRVAEMLGEDPNKTELRDRAALLPKLQEHVEKEIVPKRQAEALDSAIQPEDGKKPVNTRDLSIGDELGIEGEKVRVVDVDPDTGDVTVQDGTKFGRQRLKDGATIYVEDVEAKSLKTPTLKPMQKEGDLFVNQREDFALTGEKGTDHERLQAEREAASRAADEAKAKQDREQGALQLAGDGDTGDPFNIQQSTLPRQINPANGVPVPAGDPISVADIRRRLAASLDIPVRARGYSARNALGLFKTKAEVIRMRMINDIPTLAHEVGHYLHKILFPTGNPKNPYADWGGRFDGELMPLGARTSAASYTPHQVRMEGVAEFTREYLTDRATALAKAPAFTAFYEAQLQANHPETFQILTDARADIQRWINQPAQAKVRSMISRDPKAYRPGLFQRTVEGVHSGYTVLVNRMHPMERSVAKLRRLGLPKALAQSVTDLTTNYIGGWRGKVEHTLHYRQTDLAGNDIGPGLRQILKGLTGEDQMNLGDYLVSKRALDLSRMGKTTGIDAASAAAVVNQHVARFEPIRKQLRQFQRNNLQLLVQAGVIDAEKFRAIEAGNENYVPFYRVLETADGGGVGPRGGQGVVNTSSGLRRFKGGDQVIADPLESIIKNTYLFRDIAERNQIGEAFVSALEQTPGGGRVADQIARKVAGTKVAHEDVVSTLKANGFTDADLAQMGVNGMDLSFTLWKAASNQRDPANGIFTVWRNGKETRWQTDDKWLYNALAMKEAFDLRVFKALLPFTKGAALLRAGATLSPEFIARNPLRDQHTAAIYSKGGFIPGIDLVRGMFHVARRDDIYKDWLKSGGAHSHMTATDRASLQEALSEVVKDPSELRQMLKVVRNPIQALATISQTLEEATRVQAYQNARQKGMSEVEAANASKEATLNFARYGDAGKAINSIVAFWNASMQDADLALRMHDPRDPKQLAKVAARGLLYITVPSLLCWRAGKDDKAIQNLSWPRRNFFWNINVGKMLGKEDWVFMYPKPFLLGAIYGTSVERALDYLTGRDPNAIYHLYQALQTQNPLTPEAFIPTTARPIAEAWGNKSLYRDTALETPAMQRLQPQMRFTPQSSVLSREIASMLPDAISTSPVKIDNTIRGLTGSLGKYGTDAVDWFLVKSGIDQIPPAPSKTLSEMPLVRGFTVSPYEPTADVERFYRAAQDAEQLVATAKAAPAMLSDAKTAKWRAENQDRLDWYSVQEGPIKHIREGKERMAELHQAAVIVQRDTKMTPDQKRDRLLELAKQRNDLATKLFHTSISPVDRVKYK